MIIVRKGIEKQIYWMYFHLLFEPKDIAELLDTSETTVRACIDRLYYFKKDNALDRINEAIRECSGTLQVVKVGADKIYEPYYLAELRVLSSECKLDKMIHWFWDYIYEMFTQDSTGVTIAELIESRDRAAKVLAPFVDDNVSDMLEAKRGLDELKGE